jgi:hypothetical protein
MPILVPEQQGGGEIVFVWGRGTFTLFHGETMLLFCRITVLMNRRKR